MQTSDNINNTFFAGMYKDVWKRLNHPGLSKAEADFIIEIASLSENDKALDLMCGYGRHALELARQRIKVTAIDNEKEYIREINETANNENLDVTAIAFDVMHANIADTYKSIICMGNSFAFFNKEDATALLKNISDALQPDGTLIIGSWMIAEIALKHFKSKDWLVVDEFKYLLSYNYQPFPSRIESEHTIISNDGVTETISGVDYIFTLGEMQEMMQQAGLTIRHLFSTPKKRKFTLGDPVVYIVAEKQKQ